MNPNLPKVSYRMKLRKWLGARLWRQLTWSHVQVFLLAVIALCLAGAGVNVAVTLAEIPDQLMVIAERMALEIDGDAHSQLKPLPETRDTEAYKAMTTDLDAFLRTWMPQWELSRKIHHYYTLVPSTKKNAAIFLLSDDPKDCGQEYDISELPQVTAGFTQLAADSWFTYDAWGWAMSGYSPIRNRSGHSVGLVGVDVAMISVLHELIYKSLIPPAIGILLGLALVIVSAQRRSRDITYPLEALAAAMSQVAQGDLSQKVILNREDEIGEIAVAYNHMTEALQAGERTRDLFGRYVSPQVMQKLLESSDGIQIEGENREVTILMMDIRGFTSMTATLPPSGIVSLLNDVFRNVVTAIRNHGGAIDKYIGDMVMAVFNAPLSLEGHAVKAVDAALEMRDRIAHLNEERARKQLPLVEFVIVAHSGVVTAGSIGTPDRLSYTVIGQAVNVASRLESIAKERGASILISDATWQLCDGQFQGNDLGEVEIRGYPLPMKVWEINGRMA